MHEISKRRQKGEGTIRCRSDGRWEGRIPIGRNAERTKTRYKYVYGKTLQEVREKVTSIKCIYGWSSIGGKVVYVRPLRLLKQHITIGEWFEKWMIMYKIHSLSPSTYGSYKSVIENHIKPAIGDLYIDDIATDDIQRLVNQLKEEGVRKDGVSGYLSSSTVNSIFIIINAAFKQAIKNQMIYYNPAENVVLPKQFHKSLYVLSSADQDKLIRALQGHRFEGLFILALATGMRKGEILALTWSDVDFENKIVSVNKSVGRIRDPYTKEICFKESQTKTANGIRRIPLIPVVVALLRKHQADQELARRVARSKYSKKDLVFCSDTGEYLEPTKINKALKKLSESIGMKHINFHVLRHTFATRALEVGISAKVVQVIMGHSDVAFTLNRYTHVQKELLDHEMQKVGDCFCS